MTAKKITIDGFLDEFKSRHDQVSDRPFCWVLGSGASIQSGIPTGSVLVEQWLKELHKLEDFKKIPLKQWANAANLDIPGFEFKRASSFYPWVYHRRFRDYKEQGYAFLEKAMENAEPSFGYSVLAQIMATTHHKVAVTTNFDNLIADALSIYTRTFPLVCGHESLTGYIRANLRRPLVAKIHRDLLLAPLSNPQEIAKLPGEWATALKKILERFTPIVIGYGGNDGSLMGFLDELAPIEGGIFWCYREGVEIDNKIHDVVEHHQGRLVPIAGFDEVMLQFQEKLQLSSVLPRLQGVHDQRVAAYQKQFEALTAALRKPASDAMVEEARKPAREAAEAAVERLTKEKDWWAWNLKAKAANDPDTQEEIYRNGLVDFPESAGLTNNFAVFMERVRKNYPEAERLYRRALELEPNNAVYMGNLAWAIHRYTRDYEKAEQLYRGAMEIDLKDVNLLCNFGLFMDEVRQDKKEGERLYRAALDIDPNHANSLGNLALLMTEEHNDIVEAERLHRQAVAADPTNSTIIGNLALFLDKTLKKNNEAEQFYRQALELDPDKAINNLNFALFMEAKRKNFEEAERLYRKALDLDPDNALIIGYFADFIEKVHKDYGEAERLFKRASELDPNNQWVAETYESFRKTHHL